MNNLKTIIIVFFIFYIAACLSDITVGIINHEEIEQIKEENQQLKTELEETEKFSNELMDIIKELMLNNVELQKKLDHRVHI